MIKCRFLLLLVKWKLICIEIPYGNRITLERWDWTVTWSTLTCFVSHQTSYAGVASVVRETTCSRITRTSMLIRLRSYSTVRIKHLIRSADISGCFTDFKPRLMIRPSCKLAMRVSRHYVRSRHSLSCIGIEKQMEWNKTGSVLRRFCPSAFVFGGVGRGCFVSIHCHRHARRLWITSQTCEIWCKASNRSNFSLLASATPYYSVEA